MPVRGSTHAARLQLGKAHLGASWGAVEMSAAERLERRKKQCSLRSHLDPRRSLPLHPLHILHILHISPPPPPPPPPPYPPDIFLDLSY